MSTETTSNNKEGTIQDELARINGHVNDLAKEFTGQANTLAARLTESITQGISMNNMIEDLLSQTINIRMERGVGVGENDIQCSWRIENTSRFSFDSARFVIHAPVYTNAGEKEAVEKSTRLRYDDKVGESITIDLGTFKAWEVRRFDVIVCVEDGSERIDTTTIRACVEFPSPGTGKTLQMEHIHTLSALNQCTFDYEANSSESSDEGDTVIVDGNRLRSLFCVSAVDGIDASTVFSVKRGSKVMGQLRLSTAKDHDNSVFVMMKKRLFGDEMWAALHNLIQHRTE